MPQTIAIKNSPRLSFALINENDAELLFQLDQNPKVMRYINGGKATTQEELNNVYIPRLKRFTNKAKGWGLWKVTINTNQQFIGWILIRPMDFFSGHYQENNLEIGWRFKEESWGKGYATEAAQAVKNAIIAKTNVTKFTAIADENNHASINIMKKIGMRFMKKELYKDPLGDSEVVYYQFNV